MGNSKIIYIYTINSPFARADIEMISTEYIVKEYGFYPPRKILTPFSFILQFFYLIFNSCQTTMYICMSGGYHSFLPVIFAKLLKKKCVIIAGGTDCVSFPSIDCGNFKGGMIAKLTKWSFQYCSMILPVHKNLMGYRYTYYDYDYEFQGLKSFITNLNTPFREINYGFDPDNWIESKGKIKNSFITVAAGFQNHKRAKLKGIDLIFEIAPLFPEANFTLIGCPDGYKLPVQSGNITTYSFITRDQLKSLFNSHEFCIQVSISEGFPNAICEAMLCGCIPIGSAVGGMEDIIGDTGFILHKRDIEQFKRIISESLICDKKSLSQKASERIKSKYPKDLRKKQLLNLINSMILKS